MCRPLLKRPTATSTLRSTCPTDQKKRSPRKWSKLPSRTSSRSKWTTRRSRASGSTSSSSPATANKTKSTFTVPPADEDEDAATPKGKIRNKKKGEAEVPKSLVPAHLAEENICSSVMKPKWEKTQYVGRQDIDPCVIRDPATLWHARTVDPEHVRKPFRFTRK